MKKMLLSGIAVFGLTSLANAWERYTPQDWLPNRVVRCLNTSNALCMSGYGKTPEIGQQVTIWNRDGTHIDGILVNINSDPGSNEGSDNNGPAAPVASEFMVSTSFDEVSID